MEQNSSPKTEKLVKVKFKALTYRGKLTQFTREFSIPVFYDGISPDLDIIAALSGKSVEDLYEIDCIDQLDKQYIIDELDLACINDYYIVKSQTSKPKVKSLVQYAKEQAGSIELDDDILRNLYQTCERMQGPIKGMPLDKQLEIVIASLTVGYETRGVAIKECTDLLARINGDAEDDCGALLA
jgi:allophanate hydrolase subunit 1